MPTGAKSGSAVLLWLLGGGLIFAFCVIAALVLFFVRGSDDKGPKQVPTVTTVTVFSDTPSATATPTSTSTSQAPTLTDADRDELEGTYTCSMDDTPSFTCKIANGILEKTGGSQRFKGPISKLSNGNLSFAGSFFCPFGDCTHPVACTFNRLAPGRYACTFGPNSIRGGGPGGEHVSLVKVR